MMLCKRYPLTHIKMCHLAIQKLGNSHNLRSFILCFFRYRTCTLVLVRRSTLSVSVLTLLMPAMLPPRPGWSTWMTALRLSTLSPSLTTAASRPPATGPWSAQRSGRRSPRQPPATSSRLVFQLAPPGLPQKKRKRGNSTSTWEEWFPGPRSSVWRTFSSVTTTTRSLAVDRVLP